MPDLEKYIEDIAKDFDASKEIRDMCNEDMRFISVPGGMWEDFLTETYSDNAKRVKLEIDITSEEVMRFYGEWTLSRANISFTADDKSTTEDQAELLSGIYRGDFKDNGGQIAQDQAVLETTIAGFGAFELLPKFVDEEDPENEEQEITWVPINNAFNHVMFDQNATRSDKADARRVTKLKALSRDSFDEEYPNSEPSSAYIPNNRAEFNWCTKEVIYVATRYEVRKEKINVEVWQHIEMGEVQAFKDEDMEDMRDELLALGWDKVRERKLELKTIWQSVFTGLEFLQKPKKIAGKFLPIIPMYGYRVYVDNVEHTRGLVRKKKDGQRMFNMGVSKMTEASACSGDQVPIFMPEQVQSAVTKDTWKRADTAYKLVDPILDGNGNPVVTGPLGYTPVNQVDPNTIAAMEVITNTLQRQVGNAPQDSVNPVASGKAIDALENRQNMSSQLIKDNIQQAIKHSGRVYRAMAADVYTLIQMKKVVGIEGRVRLEPLNARSIDPQTGFPITINDLSKGRFGVDVELAPQYESQKRATIASLERVIEKLPQNSPLIPIIVSVWTENITGTGLKPLKDANRKLMLQQGIVKPETDEEVQILQQFLQQPDPEKALVLAAAKRQEGETLNLIESAKNKAADAAKKRAQTAKILSEIGSDEFLNQRKLRLVGG